MLTVQLVHVSAQVRLAGVSVETLVNCVATDVLLVYDCDSSVRSRLRLSCIRIILDAWFFLPRQVRKCSWHAQSTCLTKRRATATGLIVLLRYVAFVIH